jgi:hypothetical protein
MPTTIPLDPLAEAALKRLQSRLESEEGRTASGRQIVSALIYGATPAQAAGMLIAFTRASAAAKAGDESSG